VILTSEITQYSNFSQNLRCSGQRKYRGDLPWNNHIVKIKAVFKTSLLFGRGPLHCMVHFQRPPHHPVLRHFGFEVLAVTTRPLGPCWVVPYCCWLRRDPITVQASGSQKCRSVTDCYREWQSLKHVWWYDIWHIWQSETDHLTFMGSCGFSTKPKFCFIRKKNQITCIFTWKFGFASSSNFTEIFRWKLKDQIFFYLSGQLFYFYTIWWQKLQ